MLGQRFGNLVLVVLPRERTLAGTALAFMPLVPLVLPAAWSWFRVFQRAWQGRWRQSRWYARLVWTLPFTALLLWGWAALSRGFTPNSQALKCRIAGQPFDRDFFYSHHGPLPPLLVSSPCNKNYNLVATWINPAIVLLLLTTVVAAVALVTSLVTSSRRAPTAAASSDLGKATRGASTV